MLRIFRKKSGFTLLEMMTTVVIIGIAAAMVAPGFDRAVKRIEFKSETKDLVSMMRTARSNSIATKIPYGIHFDQSEGKLRMYEEKSSPLNDSFEWGTDSIHAEIQLDTNFVWYYAMFTNDVIIFQPNGSASESGSVYMNFDNGEVYCHSGVSVLASTGRTKLEYFHSY